MEQRCTKNRLNATQTEAFIAYIKQHPLFARGRIMLLGRQGHKKYKFMWNQLTTPLNNLGPRKTVEGWQNCWKKLKSNCKMRKAKFIKAYYKTGHDNNRIQMSDIDERPDMVKFDSLDLYLVILQTQYVKLKKLKRVIQNQITEDFEIFQINFKKGPMFRMTAKHIDILVQFMTDNPQLANNTIDPLDEALLCEQLVQKLNQLGTIWSTKAWMKSWTDLKASARQSVQLVVDDISSKPASKHHINVVTMCGLQDEDNVTTNRKRKSSAPPNTKTCKISNLIDLTTDSTSDVLPSTSRGTSKIVKETSTSNLETNPRIPLIATVKPKVNSPIRISQPSKTIADYQKKTETVKEMLEAHKINIIENICKSFIQCFDKQNEVMKDCFFELGTKILQTLNIKKSARNRFEKNCDRTFHEVEQVTEDCQQVKEEDDQVKEEDEQMKGEYGKVEEELYEQVKEEHEMQEDSVLKQLSESSEQLYECDLLNGEYEDIENDNSAEEYQTEFLDEDFLNQFTTSSDATC